MESHRAVLTILRNHKDSTPGSLMFKAPVLAAADGPLHKALQVRGCAPKRPHVGGLAATDRILPVSVW